MDKINLAKSAYLARKGYRPANGAFVFARHDATAKAVAFFDGCFNREAFKQIIEEAKKLDLERMTILVNGVATYTGPGMTVIRVDEEITNIDLANAIEDDFMADVRQSKRFKKRLSCQAKAA